MSGAPRGFVHPEQERQPFSLDHPRIREGEGGCWIWTGPDNGFGYPRIAMPGNRQAYTHREAWERVRGEIPEGLAIHHVCENRACVNVEHLECLTTAEHNGRHRGPRRPRWLRFTEPSPSSSRTHVRSRKAA